MTKSELISELSSRHTDLPIEVISKIVKIILEEIGDCLANKGRVEIRGFGAFSLRKRATRLARNPKTNKVTMVAAREAVYFRGGKDFFDILNT